MPLKRGAWSTIRWRQRRSAVAFQPRHQAGGKHSAGNRTRIHCVERASRGFAANDPDAAAESTALQQPLADRSRC
jgi:hypothetical protein